MVICLLSKLHQTFLGPVASLTLLLESSCPVVEKGEREFGACLSLSPCPESLIVKTYLPCACIYFFEFELFSCNKLCVYAFDFAVSSIVNG